MHSPRADGAFRRPDPGGRDLGQKPTRSTCWSAYRTRKSPRRRVFLHAKDGAARVVSGSDEGRASPAPLGDAGARHRRVQGGRAGTETLRSGRRPAQMMARDDGRRRLLQSDLPSPRVSPRRRRREWRCPAADGSGAGEIEFEADVHTARRRSHRGGAIGRRPASLVERRVRRIDRPGRHRYSFWSGRN